MTSHEISLVVHNKGRITIRCTYCYPGDDPIEDVTCSIIYRRDSVASYVLLFDEPMIAKQNLDFTVPEQLGLSEGYRYAMENFLLRSITLCLSDIRLLSSDLTLYDYVEM